MDTNLALTRREVSQAVSAHGWRLLLGAVRTFVAVGSMKQAAEMAAESVRAAETTAPSLAVDARPARVALTLQSPAIGWVSREEISAAQRISAAAAELGLATTAGVGAESPRSVQALEIAVDAIDIALVRPFWKAVLCYADEPGDSNLDTAGLIDPVDQGPAIWFQAMDAPRSQRNRIHVDVSVPHDEAPQRIAAALSAGGVLVSDAQAPAFWVLADPEGNEACVTSWQGRDG